jgi:hypothetical protein
MKVSRKRASRGGPWTARKLRRKAGHEQTVRRNLRQAEAARTRLGRPGRRRKIWRSRSSPRSVMVVGAAAGGGWKAMADGGGELERRIW